LQHFILTIKWFATANLLNAWPCLLTCGPWPPETVLKKGQHLRWVLACACPDKLDFISDLS